MKDELQQLCDDFGIKNFRKKYCTKHQTYHSRRPKGYPSCTWETRIVCAMCNKPFKKVGEFTYFPICNHYKDLRMSLG